MSKAAVSENINLPADELPADEPSEYPAEAQNRRAGCSGASVKALLDDLERLLPGRVIGPGTPNYSRYGRDMVSDTRLHCDPAAVVIIESTEDASVLLRYADGQGIPVTPRGGASGLSGGAIPAPGGIVVSTEGMSRILEIDSDNLAAVLEPGVKTRELDGHLAPLGLFFAGYPMSEDICTVGGNAATNAGGARAVRFGVTGDHVLGLHAVIPGGSVLRLGGRHLKDTSGLNLLPLFVGSEGTLGLITQVTLRLTPRPAVRRMLAACFGSYKEATAAVLALRRLGRDVPSAVEYMDGRTVRSTLAANPKIAPEGLKTDADAFLLVEADGADAAEADAALKRYSETIGAEGGSVVRCSAGEADNQELWRLRKAVPWWVKRSHFHSNEDVAVPPAAVPDLIRRVRALSTPLDYAVYGHAGDGNLHINPMKPPPLPEGQWPAALDEFRRALYAIVLELGGSISGEHGIGRKRTSYAARALGPDVDAAARAVKAALDPNGIMNPGVLFTPDPPPAPM